MNKRDTYYLERILKETEEDKSHIRFTYEEIINDKSLEELGEYVRRKMIEKVTGINEHRDYIKKLIYDIENGI